MLRTSLVNSKSMHAIKGSITQRKADLILYSGKGPQSVY